MGEIVESFTQKMAFLATVRSYDNQTDAEIDRSMLEGNGFTVFLLNHDAPISQIGGLLRVQLQVPAEEAERAAVILQSQRPWPKGSAEVGRNADAAIRRALIRFVFIGIALLPLIWLLLYLVAEQSLVASITHSLWLAAVTAFPVWAVIEIIRAAIKERGCKPPLQTPTSGTPAAGAPGAPPSGAAGR